MNVIIKKGLKLLVENGSTFSAMDLEAPDRMVLAFNKAFHRDANKFRPNFKSCLFIGGGACHVPRTFLTRYNCTVDIVDYDAETIKMARKEFGLKDDPRLDIIIMDALKYLELTEKTYDVILLDAYEGLTLPPHLGTKHYYEQIRKCLNKDGIVINNYFGKKNELYDIIIKNIEHSFTLVSIRQETPIHPQGENYTMVGRKP